MTKPLDLLDATDAIEAGIFLLPTVPGKLQRLEIPGLQGRLTTVSHPLANIVGDCRLRPDEVDARVHEVREIFAAKSRAFSWRVGPNPATPGFRQHLQAIGMQPGGTLAGLVLENLADVGIPPAGVHIRQAVQQDHAQVVDLIEAAYPAPRPLADILAHAFLRPQAEGAAEISVYLACERPGSEPAALGVSFRFPDRPVVVLGGAATLPGRQGQGFYQALLAHRLREARHRGAEAAVMQAVRATSAPIAIRSGFREVCEIEVFTWHPGS